MLILKLYLNIFNAEYNLKTSLPSQRRLHRRLSVTSDDEGKSAPDE